MSPRFLNIVVIFVNSEILLIDNSVFLILFSIFPTLFPKVVLIFSVLETGENISLNLVWILLILSFFPISIPLFFKNLSPSFSKSYPVKRKAPIPTRFIIFSRGDSFGIPVLS